MKTKRMLSLLLVLIMALSMLPVSALAANPLIDTINITGIPTPMDSASPDVSGITTDTPGITLGTIQWQYGNGSVMNANNGDTFAAGTEYMLYVGYSVDNGYEKAQQINITTPGFTPDNNGVQVNRAWIGLKYTVPAQQPTVTLVGIGITTPPTKTAYTEGESFDPTGMVVTAYYSDQTSRALNSNEYSYDPNGALTPNDSQVTVSYEPEPGTIKTATVRITVNPAAPGHTHTYSNGVYSGIDATHHWQICNDPQCPDVQGSAKNKAPHDDADGDGQCDVCDADLVKVTFAPNGGSGTMAPVFISLEATPSRSVEISLPACGFTPPTGKRFAGWSLPGSVNNMNAGDNYTVTGDIEFTAEWENDPNFTPTYNPRPRPSNTYNPKPKADVEDINPDTGDTTHMMGGLAVMMLASLGIIISGKKKSDK